MEGEEKEHDEHTHHLALVHEAIYHNQCQTLSAWPDAKGMRTYPSRSQTLGQSNEVRFAEHFLINTCLVRHDYEAKQSIESFFTDPACTMLSLNGQRGNAGFPEIVLPESATMQMKLGDAFKERRSRRDYSGDPIHLDTLAALLRSAAGVTATEQVASMQGNSYSYHYRTTPSAGGLYPIDLYVAALNVAELDRSCYCYRSVSDTLLQIGEREALEKLLRCFALPGESATLSRASAIFLMLGHPWRAMRKYGPRGMRFLFHEAGAMSENIHLAAVGLGLGSMDCASLYDDEVHQAMRWDGLYQALVHCIIVGRVA